MSDKVVITKLSYLSNSLQQHFRCHLIDRKIPTTVGLLCDCRCPGTKQTATAFTASVLLEAFRISRYEIYISTMPPKKLVAKGFGLLFASAAFVLAGSQHCMWSTIAVWAASNLFPVTLSGAGRPAGCPVFYCGEPGEGVGQEPIMAVVCRGNATIVWCQITITE